MKLLRIMIMDHAVDWLSLHPVLAWIDLHHDGYQVLVSMYNASSAIDRLTDRLVKNQLPSNSTNRKTVRGSLNQACS
jgi:hypothetical protein